MARARRCLFWILFLSASLFLSPVSFAETTPASGAELEKILQKVDARNYRWIAIRADTLLFFAVAGDSRAMCGGELLYQRLEERMLLTCADSQKELVFAFRTFDRRFDLYIPSQNTVYHGSIFDMEDSPEIKSHLNARDLYRALKPLAVDIRRAKLDRDNPLVTSIDVYGRDEKEKMLLRKLYLTPEGDVRGELFYNAEGKPVTEIQRYDFKKIPGYAGSFGSVIFPKKITILSPATQKGSAIFFTRVKALDNIGALEFSLRVPYGTKEVFLDEKTARLQPSKAVVSAPAREPAKKMPVYLAKPREVAAEKVRSMPSQKKKEKTEPLKTSATPPLPASAAATLSETSRSSMVAQVPAPLPPSTSDQSTLDPSVDPTA